MKSPDGATTPVWYETAKPPRYPAPPDNLRVDVCVVGAGIAGLTTAYLLAKEGKSVAVLDDGPVASGQTGRTSAHLASAIDDRFTEVQKLHGPEGSKLAYESHAAAIDRIEKIIAEEKIDCDFRRLDAYLFSVPSDPPDLLDRELEAAIRVGFKDVKKFERIILCGYETGPCLRFPRQARFQPLKYLSALAKAFEKHGGKIYTGCRVKDVQGADPDKNQPARAQLDDGPDKVLADAIVVATNTPAPINDWMGIYTKQASYRTYMIGATVPKGSVDDALYWDTGDPYHYVRLEGDKDRKGGSDLLLIGGEDHKTGQFPKEGAPFMALEKWAREKFPMIKDVTVRWSGQVQEPDDYLGFIGRATAHAKENVFVATGDSGMGLTHGTIAGILITDLIMERPNRWEKLYDPSRKMSALNKDFISENLNVVAQYKDLVTGGEVKSVGDIPNGQGAVLREGMTKVACYRDDSGKLHKQSAICTHMGCVVEWNHVEKSWDCPCHGSRFDPTGKVLMGPAIDDLGKAK
jgi:glycine/D-amino acid oxidase-like deaminating enzyme/nitrite reductase/ring-hydroxylating ferredoxin subunit